MILEQKTISSFPVSIGTSLSLESVFEGRLAPYDPERKIPQKINVNNYNEAWFNIATLFRNQVGALSNEAIYSLTPEAFALDLLQELEIIDSLFKTEGLDICKPYYYYCSYKKMIDSYSNKKIRFRESTTDKQLLYDDKYRKTIQFIIKHYPEKLISLDSSIKPIHKGNSIILTHVPYDLVSYKYFNQLDLLESHTGKLKSRYEFSTKYHPLGDEKLDYMPFLEKLLMVFGDKILIYPSDIKIRRSLIEIAKEREWTPYTTEAKVNYFIENDIKEPYFKDWLLSL